MKIRLTENKLRELVNESIKELIKEEYKVTPMEEVEYQCKYLIEYLDVYRELLENIPRNTQTILNELIENINKLGVNAVISSFKYDDDNLIVYVEGNFLDMQVPEDYEVIDYIGENIGQYNENIKYGGKGIYTAYMRGIYFTKNQNIIEIEFEIADEANPYIINKRLRDY